MHDGAFYSFFFFFSWFILAFSTCGLCSLQLGVGVAREVLDARVDLCSTISQFFTVYNKTENSTLSI